MPRRPTLLYAVCLAAALLVACAPAGPVSTTPSVATASPDAAGHGTEVLLAAIGERLGASAEVAAYKQAAGLPIDDPAREATVIDAAGEAASATGVDAERAEEVVRAQIAASRTAQAGFLRQWSEGRAEPPAAPSLDHARTVISAATTALVEALATPVACPLDDASVAAVGAPLAASGLDPATVTVVVEEAVAPLCP